MPIIYHASHAYHTCMHPYMRIGRKHTHTLTHSHTHARTQTRTQTRIHTHAREHARKHPYAHTYTHTLTHTRARTHAHANTHMQTHAHTHTRTQIRTYAHACKHAHTRAHVCTRSRIGIEHTTHSEWERGGWGEEDTRQRWDTNRPRETIKRVNKSIKQIGATYFYFLESQNTHKLQSYSPS